MESTGIRGDERTGLAVAVVLHLALLAMLIVQGLFPAPVIEPPQRMTVSLAEEVGMEATAPDPVTESRASTAPTMDLNPAPAPEQEAPAPTPPQVERPTPPRVQSPVPQPKPAPDTRPRRRPDPPRTQPQSQPRTQPQSQPQRSERSGGSRLGDNFLEGAGNSATTDDTRIPASQIGASAKASIVQALIRQIRPHWTAPQGVDAELLVTELDFDLNEDGSLKGAPRIRSQSGETASNRPQKGLHAERAIRAVQLAAPFDLPPEYYNAWKAIRGAKFDRNLSQ